jgi:hypothetical protein
VLRWFICFLVLPLLAPAAEPTFAGPTIAGQLASPPRLETSGLAASRRNPDLLWVHDDHGGAAELYAVTTRGEAIGTLKIRGAKNEDWEDLAAYELDGKAWLLIADTGDNDAKRTTTFLHIIEEPARAQLGPTNELAVRPARTLQVRYEDGARDCESVAVDANERAVYLLSKRDDVPRLYRVDLTPKDGDAILVARRVGTVPSIPQPTAAQRKVKGHVGRRRAEVTAMDFTADGSAALVLTYGDLLLFPRRAGETWAAALGRRPMRLPAHNLEQAEAACFTVDGKKIFVAGETQRALLRYER